jgi:hypothetical protein
MVDVQPHKALYYPHLEFGSVAWVKRALLYWEGLARIVAVARPNDDPEIHELVEAGLIEGVEATALTDRVAAIFGDRLEDLLHQRGGMPDSIPRARGLRGRCPELVEKKLKETERTLESQGRRAAAKAIREMPDQALTLYVTVASHAIAQERTLAPVTDDPIYSAIHTYFGEAKVMLDPKAVPGGLAAADLLVPTPSVDAVASVPVARLLELRNQLAQQRRNFREKVEAYMSSIATLPNIDAVRDHMKEFAVSIRDDLEAQRDAMRAAKAKDDWSLLSVTAPASLAVGVAIAESSTPVLGPIGGIGAAALGVTNWFFQRRKGYAQGGNYMLLLEEALGRQGRGLESGLDQLIKQ